MAAHQPLTATAPPPGHHALIACRTAPLLDSAVPALRGFARTAASGWGLPAGGDGIGLALVVGELVANAVRHSGGATVRLLLRATPWEVTVDVADDGRWRPPSACLPSGGPGPGTAGGSGLSIVEALATDVTVRRTRHGTQVLAVLPRA
ncbi:ATP-binding protein [Kitasatospora sp. NPDC051853]|uniref:ATP-binding protein n=1 Tax=Kitasatospora sp. NPDC051853 TaxID=3364058 RepID=UPI0037945D62